MSCWKWWRLLAFFFFLLQTPFIRLSVHSSVRISISPATDVSWHLLPTHGFLSGHLIRTLLWIYFTTLCGIFSFTFICKVQVVFNILYYLLIFCLNVLFCSRLNLLKFKLGLIYPINTANVLTQLINSSLIFVFLKLILLVGRYFWVKIKQWVKKARSDSAWGH